MVDVLARCALQQTGNVEALVNLEQLELLASLGKAVDVTTTLRVLTELEEAAAGSRAREC